MHLTLVLISLAVILTSFLTSASDIIDCVIDSYSPPNYQLTGLPNPSEQGQYKYTVVNYAEQSFLLSLSRPDIIAPTANLPHFLADYSRNQKYQQDAYHTFDSRNLPLKAKVWLPLAEHPLPLVVLVHGNSPPGFNYLGELLVSRGHVVVQVDQTYLNGLWGENGARGWILLEHLKLLRQWNADPSHIFYNKLNLEKIALIGMSRGGEAVALAATFNSWKTLPNSTELTGFGFNIQSIVALAPMDGQYQHADGKNILKNVNYLVLQGGHDADVYQFLGSQQWQRTQFDDGNNYLKQSIYIYRANHINFNQELSNDFQYGRNKDFYSKLLSPQQQQKLTKVFVSAFLDATLADKKDNIEILNRPAISEFGLPEDIYITRYISSAFSVLEDFDDAHQENNRFQVHSNNVENAVPFRIIPERLRGGTTTPNNVLEIKLIKNVETSLTLTLPKAMLLTEKENVLNFSIARTDPAEKLGCSSYNLLVDTRIELSDHSGVTRLENISSKASIAPLLTSDFSELETDDVKYAATEPTLQTISLPINLTERLNRETGLELRIIFTPTRDVSIIVDDIGVTSFARTHKVTKNRP